MENNENNLTRELTNEEMIKELEEKIKELKKEVDGMEKYKCYKEAADEVALIFKSFEDAGFNREETMKIILAGFDANRPKLF